MTLTDAQLVLLSAASQRDDGLLPRPAKLAGAVLRTFEASLVKTGAAEPIVVRNDQPAWRLDEAETPIGLQISRAGLGALGIEPAEQANGELQTAMSAQQPLHDLASPSKKPAAAPLRAGTKRALLVQHLSAAEGANIESLATMLTWQPHTIRAALTRLRQVGFIIIASKNAQKRAVYRIEASASQGSSAEAASEIQAFA